MPRRFGAHVLAFHCVLGAPAVGFAQQHTSAALPPSGNKLPARVPFRGTNITWDHAVTAGTFGIGYSDNTNAAARYTQGLGLAVNLFLIDPTDQDGNERDYSLRVTSALGFDVELASSRTKTRPLAPLLRDIPLSLILGKPLWRSENREWALTSAFNASFSLPTSSASRDQGIHFSISPRASLFLQVPILGQQSDFLKSIQLGLSVRYDHRFSRAALPLDPNLLNPRSTTTGHPIQSDQLAGGPVDSNGFRWGASLYMAPKLFGGDLQIFTAAGMQYIVQDPPEREPNDCDFVVAGECVDVHEQEPRTIPRTRTTFSAGVSYFPISDIGVALGYVTEGGLLGEDNKPRNLFENPAALCTVSIIIAPDAIFERLTGPARDAPVVYFGRNTPQATPALPEPGSSLAFRTVVPGS
jgi:hypothetical protein